MRKYVLFFIALVLSISCDPEFHDYFIISNKCNEKIEVNVTFNTDTNSKKTFQILPSSEYFFYSEEWVGGKSNIENIDLIFKEIVIKKGDSISHINYASHKYWEKDNIESSRKWSYYTEVNYYLYVKSEYFK
jgi:hypothetical protein